MRCHTDILNRHYADPHTRTAERNAHRGRRRGPSPHAPAKRRHPRCIINHSSLSVMHHIIRSEHHACECSSRRVPPMHHIISDMHIAYHIGSAHCADMPTDSSSLLPDHTMLSPAPPLAKARGTPAKASGTSGGARVPSPQGYRDVTARERALQALERRGL